MEKLLEKISIYHILNNLVPGSIFCLMLHRINGINMLSEKTIETVFVYYFVGMVVSRFGSLVVEPISIKFGIVKYADHHDYIAASPKDEMIATLLETNNLYRTIAASGLLVILIKVYIIIEQRFCFLSDARPYLVGIIVFVLFLLSYRKQTAYIKSRVEKVINSDNEVKNND